MKLMQTSCPFRISEFHVATLQRCKEQNKSKTGPRSVVLNWMLLKFVDQAINYRINFELVIPTATKQENNPPVLDRQNGLNRSKLIENGESNIFWAGLRQLNLAGTYQQNNENLLAARNGQSAMECMQCLLSIKLSSILFSDFERVCVCVSNAVACCYCCFWEFFIRWHEKCVRIELNMHKRLS